MLKTVWITASCHVQMHVEDVPIFAILVWVCVLEYALLNATPVVAIVQICVHGGVIHPAIKNVSLHVIHIVSVPALEVVPPSHKAILHSQKDLKEIQHRLIIFLSILETEKRRNNHSI